MLNNFEKIQYIILLLTLFLFFHQLKDLIIDYIIN